MPIRHSLRINSRKENPQMTVQVQPEVGIGYHEPRVLHSNALHAEKVSTVILVLGGIAGLEQ
jgi:hypothetical protein